MVYLIMKVIFWAAAFAAVLLPAFWPEEDLRQ